MSCQLKQREQSLAQWLSTQVGQHVDLQPVSGDASFRRYFRATLAQGPVIAVDAPPATENCQAFVEVATAYQQQGVIVPHIAHLDLQQGFMAIGDLGNKTLLDYLNSDNVRLWYRRAMSDMINIAQVTHTQSGKLPVYDAPWLRREMALFQEWLLDAHLGMTVTDSQQQAYALAMDGLIEQALAQPVVGVHRDFHSRNLMIFNQEYLAVIDFQDAVCGPVTYDLVSLLRDCYIAWPDELVYALVDEYRQLAIDMQLIAPVSGKQFRRWFDFMGVQRHLKAAGIFARLYHRDGKGGYLEDIPRVLDYVIAVCQRYDELEVIASLAEQAKQGLKELSG